MWWFDLTTKDLIWKHVIWFGFDMNLSWFDLWFEQITSFCGLSYIIVKWIWAGEIDEQSLHYGYSTKVYLSIPAFSATVERLISTCGVIISSRRARLSARTVDREWHDTWPHYRPTKMISLSPSPNSCIVATCCPHPHPVTDFHLKRHRHDSWLGGLVVERRSLIGELSLVCTGPAADG